MNKAKERGFAVVDIGSNSVRLAVFDKIGLSPVQVYNEKVMCGLGEKSGKLAGAARKCALAAVSRYGDIISAYGIGEVEAVATSALREAENGREFAGELQKALRRKVRIISGEEEARFSALGVIHSMREAEGVAADLGGGSLELAAIGRGGPGAVCSMRLGYLRLEEEYGGDLKAMEKRLMAEFRAAAAFSGRGKAIYCVGGGFRALAKLHMKQSGFPLKNIHCYEVAAAELAAFLRAVPACGGKRGRHSPCVAMLLASLIAAGPAEKVVFSTHGLREGLLYERLSREEKRADILLHSCRELGLGSYRKEEMREEIYKRVEAGFSGGREFSRLFKAACLLSGLTLSVNPDWRAEADFNLPLQLNIAGVTHRERVFIGLMLFFSHKAKLPARLKPVAEYFLTEAEVAACREAGEGMRV